MPGVGNGMVDLLHAKGERRRETCGWWDGLGRVDPILIIADGTIVVCLIDNVYYANCAWDAFEREKNRV